jgi:CBS domain-containing protein
MRAAGTDRPVDDRWAPVFVTTPGSPVAVLVSRPAVCVAGATTVSDAAALMQGAGVGALLVDGGDAIVTERDIVRGVGAGVEGDEAVSSLATPHPVAVEAATSVVRAAREMLDGHVRHLVVHLPAGVLGVISLREVAAVLLQAADPEVWLTALRAALEAPSEIWIG